MDDPKLTPLSVVLERIDNRLRAPEADTRIWTSGFQLLDSALGGGLRAGTLNILAGAQGQGKTTFALQLCRNTVMAGNSAVVFSFELEAEVLVQKLIAFELLAARGATGATLNQIRTAVEGKDGDGGLIERLSTLRGGLDALETVNSYADRLIIHRSTSSRTDMAAIVSAVKDTMVEVGASPLVVVDYLQKVRQPGEETEEDRITRITEALKDLSIEFASPVLALSASDKEGLEPGSRMRARHLRGSTSIAYEADTVLVLSNKADIVARHHLMHATSPQSFASWAVLTVEKNRNGRTGDELEFRKQFEYGGFDPEPRVVSDKLVDERVYTS